MMVGKILLVFRVTGHKYEIAWLTTIWPYSFRTHCMYLFSAINYDISLIL